MVQFKFVCVFISVSILVGVLGAGFLHALAWVTNFRIHHPDIICLLPAAGVLSVFLYKSFSPDSNGGNLLVFESLKNPGLRIPRPMAPLVVVGTLLTHLFGGSAGREGTALQMAGSLAESLSRAARISESHRNLLVRSALSAGFSAVFGTPLAAAVFALEVLLQPLKEWRVLPFTALSSLIAWAAASLLQPPHTPYPQVNLYFDIRICLFLLLLGLICGICSRFFSTMLKFCQKYFALFLPNPYFRIIIGSFLVITFTWLTGGQHFNGLGLEGILNAFRITAQPTDFLVKMLFTVLTISVGFKGGEVTPLFFIGATLGSALAAFFGVPLAMGAAVGFVCVFSGAAKTPVACALMAGELFGWPMFLLALPLTCLATWSSGPNGIYSDVP